MREDLMRRISAALDGDGLATDPELQAQLHEDVDASKYAKDLTRVNKWLATWPLPEPDDDAFEALASRIDQRIDEALPAIADVTAPPIFEDDDAVRDATAGLLQSGEYELGEAPSEPIPEPSAASKPASPIARVLLEKKATRGAVEEASGDSSGEPLSAADLLERMSRDPKKKKKKKAKASPPPVPDALESDGTSAEVSPSMAPRAANSPSKTSKAPKAPKSDRVSIPLPAAPMPAGSLAPVTELRPAKEKRPSGAWWAFAAAACVGLGVFGAATMFESGAASPSASGGAEIVTATTSLAPTAQSATVPSAPSGPPAEAPMAAPIVVAPSEAIVPLAPPVPAVEPEREADAQRSSAAAHASARGVGGSLYDQADPVAPARMHRSAAPSTSTSSASGPVRTRTGVSASPSATRPAAPTPSRAPSAPPPVTTARPSAPADGLPETPDRATIQAVLEAVGPAVQACGGDEHGTADVDVVIAASGRVTTATVHGPFAGTPIGSCIARAVRGARFPAFAQPHFQVTYPYHL